LAEEGRGAAVAGEAEHGGGTVVGGLVGCFGGREDRVRWVLLGIEVMG
jgi:hypothetical protein